MPALKSQFRSTARRRLLGSVFPVRRRWALVRRQDKGPGRTRSVNRAGLVHRVAVKMPAVSVRRQVADLVLPAVGRCQAALALLGEVRLVLPAVVSALRLVQLRAGNVVEAKTRIPWGHLERLVHRPAEHLVLDRRGNVRPEESLLPVGLVRRRNANNRRGRALRP